MQNYAKSYAKSCTLARQTSSRKPKFSDPIWTWRMRREEVKAQHGRLRKGYGYHQWLGCDCRTRIQDRALTDRWRAMKMAAAAGNGDEQDRIEGSTTQDPADGVDSFSFGVTNFSSPLRMQLSTEPPSSEGAMDGVQGSQGSMTKPQGQLWAQL